MTAQKSWLVINRFEENFVIKECDKERGSERERERQETEEQVIFLLILLYYVGVAINTMIASRSVVTPLGTRIYLALAPQYLVNSEASRVLMLIFSILLQLRVSWGHRRGLKCLYLFTVLTFCTITPDRVLFFTIESLAQSYDGVLHWQMWMRYVLVFLPV